MPDDLNARLGLDSSDFKTQLTALNREIRVLESGFRSAAAPLGDWANQASGLERRIDSLNDQMEVQTEKVKRVRAEWERVAAEQGDNSRAAKELEIRLNKESETLGKMDNELRQAKNSLDKMGRSSNDTADKTNDLKRSEDRAKTATSQFGNALGQLPGQLNKVKRGLGDLIGKLGQLAGKLAIGVVGAATVATAALGAFAISSIGPASDLNETISKTQQVFGSSADIVLEFGKQSARGLGMSNNAALAAAATYGNLFRSMGMAEDTSAEMSTSLVTLAGDLASFNNMDPTEVLDKLRAGLTGEAEPLKSLGVNINQALIQEKAYEMGLLKRGDAMDAATKAQASYALILEQTTLAQGDFARTSEGLANQQRISAGLIENIKAKFGSALLPLITKAQSALNNLLESPFFTGALERVTQSLENLANNDAIDKFFNKIGSGDIGGAFSGLFESFDIGSLFKNLFAGVGNIDIGDTIGDLIATLLTGAITKPARMLEIALKILNSLAKSITTAIPTLIPTVTTLLTSLVEFLVQNLPVLLQASIQILLALVDGILSQLPMLIKVAVELIVMLAQGISKAIPQLLPVIAEIIPEIIIALIESLPLLIEAALELIIALVDGLIIALPVLIAAVPQIMTALIEAFTLMWPKVKEAGEKLLKTIVDGITAAWPKMRESGKEIGNIWIKGVKENIATFLSIGGDIVTALWNGLKQKEAWLREQIKKFFQGIMDGIKNVIDWHSPPGKYVEIGAGMAQALGIGFTGAFGQVDREITKAIAALSAPETSLAFAGAGGGNRSQTQALAPVTVNANVASEIDIHRLARLVAEEQKRQQR